MPNEISFKLRNGKEFKRERTAVAEIDSEICVNCGICRRHCPTEAIVEYQRDICRLCPDCQPTAKMFPEESKRYAPQHACSLQCPLGTIPEGYVNMVAQGKIDLAYDLIAELNPLPLTCAMICHHPCEDDCKRGKLIDRPIAIRALKRYVVEHVAAKPLKYNQRFDKKIAIIGAGPAGLVAAADLAEKGYGVKIFEAGSEAGGMALRAIPDFRINKKELLEEAQRLLNAGVEIEYACTIGKNPSIKDLLADQYAAVIIAVGAGEGAILPLPGTEAEQVYDALSLMKRMNRNEAVKLGKKAVVIGGGSVALDTARSLKRLGLDVTCACLESGDAVPAPAWELEEAAAEGIPLIEGVAPQKVNTDWFTVKSVEFKKVEHIEKDELGRLKAQTMEGSEFTVDCDTLVFATGQRSKTRLLAEGGDLATDAGGRIIFDPETLASSVDNVFVAGDVIEARGSVISAMASGRRAALSVDNLLMDRELSDRRIKRSPKLAPPSEKIYPAVRLEKLDPQAVPKSRFRDSFDMVEAVYLAEAAQVEAKRCMKCGYSAVDTDYCIGCAVCVEYCPAKAISMVKG